MKKLNKKGFTIVELVIVIAVIAILASVMIPTFSGLVEKAHESAELQAVAAAYKNALIEVMADGAIDSTEATTTVDGYTFTFDVAAQKLTGVAETTGFTYVVENGVVTAANKK